MSRYAAVLLAATFVAAITSPAVAQQGAAKRGSTSQGTTQQGTPTPDAVGTAGSMMGMTAVTQASVAFGDISIPGFAPGLKIAVINGNPDVAGPYTVRLSFPDGYRFPPHYHPNAENLTVLSGTFRLAMGTNVDESQLKAYSPGDYLYLPGGHPHFGSTEGATVIQLHGDGPFKVLLVQGGSSR